MGSEFHIGADRAKMGFIFRHMMLTDFLKQQRTWGKQCGEIIVACDGENYWRRAVFPNYKHGRAEAREESKTDWSAIFEIMAEFREELKAFFPWKVLRLEGAEADDIVPVLTKYFVTQELVQTGLEESCQHVMNVSSDGDFKQLYKYRHYAQWSPQAKAVIPKPEPTFLVDKIIRGDGGDGIPSVLCPDDFYLNKAVYGRAPSVNAKVIAKYTDLSNLNEEELARYRRNETLISFEKIPLNITKSILLEYRRQEPVRDKGLILEYLNKFRLRQLTEQLNNF
jgi:DNA-directed RNA polymerase subunit F